MPAATKNPAKRCNADGAVHAEIHIKGNHVSDSTPIPEPFPLSAQAGRHAAQLWLSTANPSVSMLDWRENRWNAHASGMGFDASGASQRHEVFDRQFSDEIVHASVAAKVPTRDGQMLAAVDRLDTLAAQASSLSAILYGVGGEVFRTYSDTIQDNVLWLLSDITHEIGRQVTLAFHVGSTGARND